MRQRRATFVGMLAGALLACQRAPTEPAEGGGLGDLLAREVAAQLSPMAFAAYAIAAATIAALLVVLRLLLVSLWRLGFDGERRLSILIPVAQVLSGVFALAWVVARWSRLSPHLLVALFPLVSLGLLGVFAGHIRNLLAGALIVLGRRIRPGNRIQVGGHSGVVRDVGLGRTALRCADGSRVYVPNQELIASTLAVARERLTEPVEVVLSIGQRDGTGLLEAARRLALLCPYRALGTALSTDWDEGSESLRIKLHAWSEGAAVLARQSLRNAVVLAMEAPLGRPGPRQAPPSSGDREAVP